MRFPSVAPRAPPPGSAGSPGPDVRRWKGLAPHRGRLLTNVPSAEWAKCLQDAESAQDAPAGPGETGGAPPWPLGDADGSSGPPAERLAALGVRSAATLILGFKRVETSTRRTEGSGGGAECVAPVSVRKETGHWRSYPGLRGSDGEWGAGGTGPGHPQSSGAGLEGWAG